jgi:hypothetical protein
MCGDSEKLPIATDKAQKPFNQSCLPAFGLINFGGNLKNTLLLERVFFVLLRLTFYINIRKNLLSEANNSRPRNQFISLGKKIPPFLVIRFDLGIQYSKTW